VVPVPIGLVGLALARRRFGSGAVVDKAQTCCLGDALDCVRDNLGAACRLTLLSNHIVDRAAWVIGHRGCAIGLVCGEAVRAAGCNQGGWHAERVIRFLLAGCRPVRRARCHRVTDRWLQGAAGLQPRSGTHDRQNNERWHDTPRPPPPSVTSALSVSPLLFATSALFGQCRLVGAPPRHSVSRRTAQCLVDDPLGNPARAGTRHAEANRWPAIRPTGTSVMAKWRSGSWRGALARTWRWRRSMASRARPGRVRSPAQSCVVLGPFGGVLESVVRLVHKV